MTIHEHRSLRPGATVRVAPGRLRRVLAAGLACGVLLGPLSGCGDDGPAGPEVTALTTDTSAPSQQATTKAASRAASRATERPTALDADHGYAVTAAQPQVQVRDAPDGRVLHTLDNPQPSGAPLTFLLDDDPATGWLRVLLPVRPNGSTGWVSADDVTVAAVPYRLEMSTTDNELTLLRDGEPVRTFPAASGTGDTPTPLGTFYLTELIEPTNTGYGPYAYGLSGFSEMLSNSGGGPG